MSIFTDSPSELLDESTKFWLMEQFRQQLKELRKEHGMTQTEVADKLGKDQVFISNCESGRRRIDPVELLAFASVFDISLQEMVQRLDLDEAIERDYRPGG
ncbi:MAG: helix-turn-helix domain-containing protein [bacterium]